MTDYRSVKTKTWTKEQIEQHLKAIGADKPPERPSKGPKSVTAPKQLNGSGKYYRSGGEW
ncbi:hypothetical protein [Paenibacillus sp. JJ-223]|uniref:hypothetical protein n=1 Tax=Paenibacillus sp. JJ-223 TaxID=2905647 RepID=UPI001F1CD10C|nr:hypothetical protein [Paenibacillus sp. JJ-223]CAH1216009.1 hypothetical protein PAECIP111890_04333 [Paenibacillus sp. JJ-223]